MTKFIKRRKLPETFYDEGTFTQLYPQSTFDEEFEEIMNCIDKVKEIEIDLKKLKENPLDEKFLLEMDKLSNNGNKIYKYAGRLNGYLHLFGGYDVIEGEE